MSFLTIRVTTGSPASPSSQAFPSATRAISFVTAPSTSSSITNGPLGLFPVTTTPGLSTVPPPAVLLSPFESAFVTISQLLGSVFHEGRIDGWVLQTHASQVLVDRASMAYAQSNPRRRDTAADRLACRPPRELHRRTPALWPQHRIDSRPSRCSNIPHNDGGSSRSNSGASLDVERAIDALPEI